VSVSELKTALEKNEAVVVDVRGEVEYDLGHIRGSRSIPLGLIASRAGELPRDKLIVTYCA
jgi:rhodanese-related sulfurtransferase